MDYYILDLLPTFLIAVIVFLIVYWKFNESRKTGRLPPGPPTLPLVGSLPFLGADIREPLRQMAQKYGDMMTVYLGSRQIIYLNTYDVIKEAFVKNSSSFLGRPQDLFWMKDLCGGIGLTSSEGQRWKEHRRFVHTALKDFGMGREILEPKIHEEIQCYLQVLEGYNGKPMDPQFLTIMAISNVILSIVNGHRHDYEDEYFNRYVRDLYAITEELGDSAVIMAFPFLKYLPGDAFSIKSLMKRGEFHKVEWKRRINAHKESHEPENPRDFIDTYITRMNEERKVNPNSTFSDEQLCQVIIDLFGAGTETTSNTFLWSMVYMLNYPDVMKRCQSEIDEVIGRHRAPSMKDKASLPYVESTLLEIQRMTSIAPFGIPHTNTEDIEFKGYYFPKGTNFVSNIYAVHMDPVKWPEPEVFNPSRHLTAEGKIIKKDEFVAFSVGKRACVGESLAKTDLFLFFTSLLQSYDLVLPPMVQAPSTTGKMGTTHTPPVFNVEFHKRI